MTPPQPETAGARPRQVAARALRGVLDEGRSLDSALPPLLEPLSEGRDRALARRLCHGVLRDWPALDALIAQLVDRPLKGRHRDVHFLLAVALHELRDGREPDHAVVHAAVAAARALSANRLTKLVNGVLRSFGRERERLLGTLPSSASLRFGYPAWLIRAIEADRGDDAADVLAAGNQSPPLWRRVNRRKVSPAQVDYVVADIFEWRPTRRYDTVFFSLRVRATPARRLFRRSTSTGLVR